MATFAPSFTIFGDAGFPRVLAGKNVQPISETSAIQKHPLGTRCLAHDPVLGEAEFIYAKGVASTAATEVIQINANFTTTRAAGGTIKGHVGVAMSANVANQYGWYCVKGRVPVLIAADVTADLSAYATATAGTVADDIVAGSQVVGMMLEAAADAGGSAIVGTEDTTAAHAAIAFIHYPFVIKAV